MTKKSPLSAGIILSFILTVGTATVFAQDPTTDPDVTPTPNLPDTPYEYVNIALPSHFNVAQIIALDNTPADNPITNDGATLGRVLFYETPAA